MRRCKYLLLGLVIYASSVGTSWAVVNLVYAGLTLMAPVLLDQATMAVGAMVKYRRPAGGVAVVNTRLPLGKVTSARILRDAAVVLGSGLAAQALSTVVSELATTVPGCGNATITGGVINCNISQETGCPANWQVNRASVFCMDNSSGPYCTWGGGSNDWGNGYLRVFTCTPQTVTATCPGTNYTRTLTVQINCSSQTPGGCYGFPISGGQSRLCNGIGVQNTPVPATDDQLFEGLYDSMQTMTADRLHLFSGLLDPHFSNQLYSSNDILVSDPALATGVNEIQQQQPYTGDQDYLAERTDLAQDLLLSPQEGDLAYDDRYTALSDDNKVLADILNEIKEEIAAGNKTQEEQQNCDMGQCTPPTVPPLNIATYNLSSGFASNTFSFAQSCSGGYSFSFMGHNYSIPYDPLCSLGFMVSPIVIGLAGLFGYKYLFGGS